MVNNAYYYHRNQGSRRYKNVDITKCLNRPPGKMYVACGTQVYKHPVAFENRVPKLIDMEKWLNAGCSSPTNVADCIEQ